RTLLSATLTSAIAPITVASGASPTNIDLSTHLSDPAVTGTAVQLVTSQGTLNLGLDDSKTPTTVSNFLHYVVSGEYNGTVLQRAIPGFILQGGGFLPNQNHIATGSAIPSEAGVSNTAGTIAMALSNNSQGQTDPNSATSDWFLNLANNSANLDPAKFTAFGNVLYNGMTVANAIASLPKGEVGPNFVPPPGETSAELPLQNWNSGSPITPSNFVTITSASIVPAVSYTVSSDNPSLVGTTLSGTNLTLSYGAGTGVAHVTVQATDLANNTISTTFLVGVGVQQVNLGGKGNAKVVRFTDPNGASSQITLSGAGTASVLFGGSTLTTSTKGNVTSVSGTPSSVSVSTAGTSARSTLTITGHGGNGLVTLAGISTDGAIRAITGRNTALVGSLSSPGSIGTLTLSAASGGTISAPSIGRMVVRGAFSSNLSTSGSISSITLGSIAGGGWNVANAGVISTRSAANWAGNVSTLKKLTVAGTLDSSTIQASNTIASVTAVEMTDSNVLAGLGVAALPSQATQFTNPAAAIGVVRVSKIFQGSNIAAGALGNISAGTVQTSNSGAVFGVAAHTIKAFNASVGGKRLHLARVTSESQVTAALQSINQQDFTIRIF
ncbi:MAG TPA: peptidylprolyl isomerase, partial [Tepidisphaeraceae bacterium]|nr:peptidylprolyl isomerase [Tepidisphaeraceae bacterium]